MTFRSRVKCYAAGCLAGISGLLTHPSHWVGEGHPYHQPLIQLSAGLLLVCFFCLVVALLASVEASEEEMKVKSGFCPDCGYDLRATPTRCPECGLRIDDA